jgi:glycosidase
MKPTTRFHTLLLFALLAGSLGFSQTVEAQTGQADAIGPPTPEWVRSSVVYQIFPRNFSQAGDLNSITVRLDELEDLGVNILWLMPIHPIGEKMRKGSLGSPYAVRDFYAVNPDLGTPGDLKRLIDAAHKRDMKVVLDFVAGHTAWDSVMMETPDYYRKDSAGNIISPNPEWTDVAALDYENEALRRYMIDVLKYWEREYDVDGFRCDVAFTVPTDFWESAREELMEINPEVIMFADANATPELLAKAVDMDDSWPLFYALNRVISGASSAEFLRSSWENTRQQFPEGALHLRFSDSQPEPRAVARFGMQGALAAQALMLSLDGVPLIYNGMEVGDATESADPALFEKSPVVWNPTGRPPLRNIYRDLIKLRRSCSAFHNDEVIWLTNNTPEEVVTLMRMDDKDEFVLVVNLSSRPRAGSVEVAHASEFEPVNIDGMPELADNPFPDYRLGGYGWRLYRRSLTD